MPNIKDYLFNPRNRQIFHAPLGDPLRRRIDLREPTIDEFNAWFGIKPEPVKPPVVVDDEPVGPPPVLPPLESKRRGRQPKK